jgi:hypothetical protein
MTENGMTAATERLIGRLAQEARPVRRLASPLLSAALFLLAVAILGALAVALFANMAVFERRIADPKLVVEVAATLVTGLLAVVAAFELSRPDRSWRWTLLPLPTLLLWIASSGYSCWQHLLVYGPQGWVIGESADCFRFILAVSVPLGVALLLVLRRARPLTPVKVAAMGGLGVAALAAFLLQFFHPFDVTFMDLGIHALAVTLVVLAASGAETVMARRADG